jgi:cytochrome c oxidase cbb3-type subunit 3
MSRDTNEIMGHADDNDGIEEYDNPLPDWWLGMLIGTVIWAGLYAVDFHFISQRSQVGWYEAEMAAAAEMWPQSDKAVAVDLSPETIAKGAEVFKSNCVACHGAELQGGIGPNLTDTEWIHGGSAEQVAATITNGVPAKGMLAWGPILGPQKIAQVTAFVLSRGPKE